MIPNSNDAGLMQVALCSQALAKIARHSRVPIIPPPCSQSDVTPGLEVMILPEDQLSAVQYGLLQLSESTDNAIAASGLCGLSAWSSMGREPCQFDKERKPLVQDLVRFLENRSFLRDGSAAISGGLLNALVESLNHEISYMTWGLKDEDLARELKSVIELCSKRPALLQGTARNKMSATVAVIATLLNDYLPLPDAGFDLDPECSVEDKFYIQEQYKKARETHNGNRPLEPEEYTKYCTPITQPFSPTLPFILDSASSIKLIVEEGIVAALSSQPTNLDLAAGIDHDKAKADLLQSLSTHGKWIEFRSDSLKVIAQLLKSTEHRLLQARDFACPPEILDALEQLLLNERVLFETFAKDIACGCSPNIDQADLAFWRNAIVYLSDRFTANPVLNTPPTEIQQTPSSIALVPAVDPDPQAPPINTGSHANIMPEPPVAHVAQSPIVLGSVLQIPTPVATPQALATALNLPDLMTNTTSSFRMNSDLHASVSTSQNVAAFLDTGVPPMDRVQTPGINPSTSITANYDAQLMSSSAHPSTFGSIQSPQFLVRDAARRWLLMFCDEWANAEGVRREMATALSNALNRSSRTLS
ncbi:unnamed protein product [Rhizoctonia solani]|uniref:Uncharacterized protein n=1 Tax=Rhizoctonia solani TaxID=456999 RepID=A0A8H3H5X0_9AGAM|nr:unnamed protein product [Rhizoctonia solani]CAE6497234.1 unnamed protein product [Rhizoctonia solani]